MTFFKKSSILFLFLNAIRFLSVLSIIMAFAGEMIVLVNDVKGYQAATSGTTSTSSSSSPNSNTFAGTTTYARLARRSARPFGSPPVVAGGLTARVVKRDYLGSHGSSILSDANDTLSNLRSSSSLTPSGSSSGSSSGDNESSSSTTSTACSYVGNTSIPKGPGGIVFVAISRIFCCILLFFMLISETPPPTKWTQKFWSYAFPPFGENFGVGVLGVVQVYLGSVILSHKVTGFPLVAAWFLFILGFVNMLLGLSFGSRLKKIRSFSPYQLDDGLTPLNSRTSGPTTRNEVNERRDRPNRASRLVSGLRAFTLGTSTTPFCNSHAPSTENSPQPDRGHDTSEKRRGRPIHISAPMQQQNGAAGDFASGSGTTTTSPVVVPMPPPIYHAQMRRVSAGEFGQ
ncbi:BZ3500_MvSof-1268-A1-R1_Chr9g10315 [Microbotryum saponariae]|uniref:BZ3500_MvSof-1268-A1-R1_Chr9g10315 protein n=1 Tax=Microbotryum saponariae TaxID=289078 RepID=A0A2X0LU36_9BASI|nr:BZ3501_MvSof-1269-A2-R1_Chr9g10065 [Microbotryum saponariae]SCZ99895.1 BZ3500_MvSof-1268-A1-R1_Chr9g10315 [Microbotryum saponariae]